MSNLSEFIYLLDKAIFLWLRETLGGGWLDGVTVIMGNAIFWMPLFVFLTVYLVMVKIQRPFLNLFFGLAAYVLAFQVATLLSHIFGQPSPYVAEYLNHGLQLPAFINQNDFNLPDWTVAGMVAALRFTRLRLRNTPTPLPVWTAIFPLVLGFSRVLPGYAYPMDVITGWLVGLLIAFFMHHFARNVEIVMTSGR